MSKALRISLIVIGILVASAALLWTGIMIGRYTVGVAGLFPGGMMGFQTGYAAGQNTVQVPYGMMGGGMMGGYEGSNWQENSQYGYGMMGQGVAPGYGGMGMMGSGMVVPGMMGGNSSDGLSAVEPLSIDQAKEALDGYLNRLNNPDLEVKEVMIFDNQAYAEIVEKSTSIGAMEVLVDPLTLAVYPEYGPNMMWNLKYGMMSGAGANGMMGSVMMGAGGQNAYGTEDVSAEMPVSPDQAVEAAQKYLDRYYPGKQVEDHADVFYGYYTLHVLRDVKVVGMLSVNGYSGKVFPHTWHGDFVEMSEEE